MSKFYNEMQHRLAQAAMAELVRQSKPFTHQIDVGELIQAILRGMKRVPHSYLRGPRDLPMAQWAFVDRMHDAMIDAFLADEAMSDADIDADLARYKVEFPTHSLRPLAEVAVERFLEISAKVSAKVSAKKAERESPDLTSGCAAPCGPGACPCDDPAVNPAPVDLDPAELSPLLRRMNSHMACG